MLLQFFKDIQDSQLTEPSTWLTCCIQGWSPTRCPRSTQGTQYLSIVLPELVPPHVVALEHGHRAVEPRHVQAQIIRADLLVCRVGKHLPRESACSDKAVGKTQQ